MTHPKPDLVMMPGGVGQPEDERTRVSQPAQHIGTFEVPRGYEVWGDGLYRVLAPTPDDPTIPSPFTTPSTARRQNLQCVCHQPIWIRRVGTVLDTNETLVELEFKDSVTQQFRALWVDRLQLATKLNLTRLARQGLGFTEVNAGLIITYLDTAFARNGRRVEHVSVLGRTGAYTFSTGTGWLLGEQWIGPPDTKVVPDPRLGSGFTKGYALSGDADLWLVMWTRVTAESPIARWLLYSTFAAPLLRFLRQRTFIVHHWGSSGGGKSAIAKLGMSAWGDPQMLTMTFNRTEKSFTEVFKYASDIPIVFDELQATDRDTLAKVLYWLTLERSRSRATQTGGLQDESGEGWKSVIRMTGEEPVVGKGTAVDLGGQANRVVQVNAPALSEHTAREIHQWLEQRHFGWGAQKFLGHLAQVLAQDQSQGLAVLNERYTQIRDTLLAETVGQESLQATVAHVATVALAEYLALRWFYLAPPEQAFNQAVDDARAVLESLASTDKSTPVHEQALRIIEDHFVGHRSLWLDLENPAEAQTLREGRQKLLVGVRAPEELWLVQSAANELLARAGLPARRVWHDLRAAGLLVTSPGSGVYGVVRRHGKFRATVYAIRQAAPHAE